MKKKRKKRVQKQKQSVLQLSRNPFDRDPFRKKQQIAVPGGEEVLGASADTAMKAKEVIRTLEEIRELSKQHKS